MMRKLSAYIKSSKLPSKILMGVWLFLIVITLFAYFSAEKENPTIDNVVVLLVMYGVFSILFLIPAVIINQSAKAAPNQSSTGQTQKSWLTTLLLCLFFGHVGVHRFYVGKIASGIVYLCTMGCFGIGSLIDLIVIAMGKFTDKNGNIISYDAAGASKQRFSPTPNPNAAANINKNSAGVNPTNLKKQASYPPSAALRSKKASGANEELRRKREKWQNGGKEKLEQWRISNGYAQQNDEQTLEEQLQSIYDQSFCNLKNQQIKPFGESATLAQFHQVQVQGYLRVVRESIELMRKTTNPSVFFRRYEAAVSNVQNSIALMKQYGAASDAEELLKSLTDGKESLVNGFIDRCVDQGILAKAREEILQYQKHLTKDNISYMNSLLEKTSNNANALQYSDVTVSGETEKTQPIPQRNADAAERNKSASSGLNLSPTRDRASYRGLSYSENKFFTDMAKFEHKEGKEAAFVPFMQYWPSYDSMNKGQKDWYFYWRSQARKSVYFTTDLSYLFVHIYELLSGYGWTNPQEGYDQIIALWKHYRTEYPQLDRYLVGWTFDFTLLYQLPFSIPKDMELSLPDQPVIRDMMIEKHSSEKPLKLSFDLIDRLCDYSLVRSKFYQEGHQSLMREAIPRVVALADAALIKKSDKGILDTYGPARPKKQPYYVFQSANCIHANERMDLSVKGYTSSQKLRGYINELVRYAENVLRELYGCRGRLRGVALEDETASLVKAFLKKEYSPEKTTELAKKAEVKLDFENIKELRDQSDAVREALEVTDDTEKVKELLTDLQAAKEIFTAMPHYCRTLMDTLRENSWEMEYHSSIQASIEKINELSEMQLACALLVVEENTLILEDDFRDEFSYIYEHLHEVEKPKANEVCDSKFNSAMLSDEMKQLFEALSPIQEEILFVILTQDDVSHRIEEIANAEMSMPEILIDEINDIATQCIGDILIDTFGDEVCVLEQYTSELKQAIK